MLTPMDYRVLLVDGHNDSRSCTAASLRLFELDVLTAATKAEALSICESESFDVLVSGLRLSDGSGWELMQELAGTCGVRGIAYTGLGSELARKNSLEAGFSVHLLKPSNIHILVYAIRRLACEPSFPFKGQSMPSPVGALPPPFPAH